MKDTDLQRNVLQLFYNKRNDYDFYIPRSGDIEGIRLKRIYAICEQLHELGLIEWNYITVIGTIFDGKGKITEKGIQELEYEKSSTQGNSINMDNLNIQEIKIIIQKLIDAIDKSNGKPEEKAEAKSILKAAFTSPVLAALIGTVKNEFFN